MEAFMKKFKLEITEEGLNTIIQALECYSRLGMGQFKCCLEHLPDFDKLDYKTKVEVEIYLQSLTGRKNFGIFHPEVGPFTKAYEIKAEILKRVSLARTGGVRDTFTHIFDGALYDKDYLPKFLDKDDKEIEDCKTFPIPIIIRPKLKKLAEKKDFEKMWEMINEYVDFKNIKGSESVISEDLTRVTVWEPYFNKYE